MTFADLKPGDEVAFNLGYFGWNPQIQRVVEITHSGQAILDNGQCIGPDCRIPLDRGSRELVHRLRLIEEIDNGYWSDLPTHVLEQICEHLRASQNNP